MVRYRRLGLCVLILPAGVLAAEMESVAVWERGRAAAALVPPGGDERAARLVQATFGRHLRAFYGVELPAVKEDAGDGLFIVAGTPENNAVLAGLVGEGLRLRTDALGDEGFQIVTHAGPRGRHVVIHGTTPRALKHGCQELIFYLIRATPGGGRLPWPLDVVRRPELAYRGIYILPCWSQHDSIESWRRVLLFTSELTLNRVWFWLDGFPVAGHPATSYKPGGPIDYDRTPLASNENVQSLIDLVNAEDQKFYIGGGWMSWHHQQAVGKDPAKAEAFYRDYLRQFKGFSGFYFEPTGEGKEVKDWRPEAQSLRDTIRRLLADRPEFEVAVAIGRFNNPEYLKLMSGLDSRRVYWWWCWGDPLVDDPFAYYPTVLGWHTTVRMSDMHGTSLPPGPAQRRLAGVATSYDPGMGFGNPWNGGSTLWGAKGPRDFHPHTLPYFSHEYRFRERCWDTNMSDERFAERLRARLFDADMPAEAVGLYLKLAGFCPAPAKADPEALSDIAAFVDRHAGHGTPRNRDTLARMREALEGIHRTRVQTRPAPK
ncbi:MAG: hypothetical protein AMXMBFR83_29550 [Phycisphaerae bacterium]